MINKKPISRQKDSEVLSLFPLDNYDQNINQWINPNDPNYDIPLLTADVQQKHLRLFYEHNYGKSSPWDKNFVSLILHKTPPHDVITIIKAASIKYNNRDKEGDAIGYGENFRPYPPDWEDKIMDNINIAQFSNLNYNSNNRAIAINNLRIRALPTNDVHFYDNKIAGQGYPFDNLQMSAIWAGTPLYVAGTTKDKNWSFVIAYSSISYPWPFTGWVESNEIAKASNNFITKWQKAAKSKLGAITLTQTSIIDLNGRFLFSAYVGSVFPMVNSKSTLGKKLMIPVAENNEAVIRYSIVPDKNVTAMPLSPTMHNMANLISSLIGRPYGWGNMYFYNDCSAELKNLLTPFGIWLPRNALSQAEFVKENFYAVDMSDAAPSERLSYLMQNGKPFFTMIYIEGHIFLYIGNHPNSHNKESSLMAMTYQNIWGLGPVTRKSRTVIGGSVFLPLLLQYPEVPSLQSLAAKKYFSILYLDRLL